MPERMMLLAAVAASRILSNDTIATLVSWGMGASFIVTSVTIPKVPSAPTKNVVRLYPAEVFRGRLLVLITVPSASTTVRLMTQSFIVPYLMALVPEQFVETMPPICAVTDGSSGANRPTDRRALAKVNKHEARISILSHDAEDSAKYPVHRTSRTTQPSLDYCSVPVLSSHIPVCWILLFRSTQLTPG